MLSKFLAILAWAGLYRATLVILNYDAHPSNDIYTPMRNVDITSRFMQELLDTYATKDGRKLAYRSLEESQFYYQKFHELHSLLKSVDPQQMNEYARKAFFINLYNILTIDAILSMVGLPRSTSSVTQFWRRYAYQVGRYTFNLDEIEHGILRGNRPHPTSGDIMFDYDDPRLMLSVQFDHRIHAVLNCAAVSCPPLSAYTASGLDNQMDFAIKNLCREAVSSINKSTMTINSIFDWYMTDFGATEDLMLRFLAECVDEPTKRSALLAAAEGKRYFTYYYDWSLNSMSYYDTYPRHHRY